MAMLRGSMSLMRAASASATLSSRRFALNQVTSGRFMASLATDRLYAKSHEWLKKDGDLYIVGITKHAADALGEIVFVQLPELTEHAEEDPMGVIESVKAASDLVCPITGTVMEVNSELEKNPALVNSSPMDDGWFLKMKVKDEADLEKLLDADAYEKFCENEK